MKKIFGVRIHLGTNSWGWRMYGIGYKSLWFFGFSINRCMESGKGE